MRLYKFFLLTLVAMIMVSSAAYAVERLWGGYHGSCDWGVYNCDDPTEAKWGVGAAPLNPPDGCDFNDTVFGSADCTF